MLRHRALAFQPPAYDLDQRLLRTPLARGLLCWGCNCWIELGIRPERTERGEALGGDPYCSGRQMQARCAPLCCELSEPVVPATRRPDLRLGCEPETGEAVMQL